MIDWKMTVKAIAESRSLEYKRTEKWSTFSNFLTAVCIPSGVIALPLLMLFQLIKFLIRQNDSGRSKLSLTTNFMVTNRFTFITM